MSGCRRRSAACWRLRFRKAFKTVFISRTALIEKTFDKESAGLEFEAGDYIVGGRAAKKPPPHG